MGVLIFFVFMAILFFSAFFFIVLNLIFIIIWKLRKGRGKNPKKSHLIIPTIFLVISFIVELIPIGWIGFLRYANRKESKKVIIAESGKIVYWDTLDNGDANLDRFEMDDINYVSSKIGASKDTWKLEKPVANIRYKSHEEGLNKVMDFLFAYDNTSMLYPVINNGGFDLYTTGGSIYCPENEKNFVSAYYKDFLNYDTQNCRCKYGVFSESKVKEGGDSKTDFNSTDIVEDITLNQNVFETLYEMNDSQAIESIKIPEKYSNIRNAKKTGDSVLGYNYRIVHVYSKDKIASKDVTLNLIDGQLYREVSSGGGNLKGYRLPTELNEYLKNTIFQDK